MWDNFGAFRSITGRLRKLVSGGRDGALLWFMQGVMQRPSAMDSSFVSPPLLFSPKVHRSPLDLVVHLFMSILRRQCLRGVRQVQGELYERDAERHSERDRRRESVFEPNTH